MTKKEMRKKDAFSAGFFIGEGAQGKKAERLQNDYLHWKNFKKQRWFCHINHSVQKWKRRK